MSITGQRKLVIGWGWGGGGGGGGGQQTNIFDIVLGQHADVAVGCLDTWQKGD